MSLRVDDKRHQRHCRQFSILAAEELITELGAAFLCAEMALAPEPRPDHAAYVASWLKMLQGDKPVISTAAVIARQAADWMHSRQDAADQAGAGQSRAA